MSFKSPPAYYCGNTFAVDRLSTVEACKSFVRHTGGIKTPLCTPSTLGVDVLDWHACLRSMVISVKFPMKMLQNMFTKPASLSSCLVNPCSSSVTLCSYFFQRLINRFPSSLLQIEGTLLPECTKYTGVFMHFQKYICGS